jgi:type I restriction enzyme S subunit
MDDRTDAQPDSSLITQPPSLPTRRFRPYPDYQNSDAEWIGEIPSHWSTKRLKNLVHFQGGGTPSKENIQYWSGNIPWVSPKDMKTRLILDTADKITVEAVEESATNLVDPGAVLLVVRSGILNHSIPVAIAGITVALNQDLKALIPGADVLPKYLSYVIDGKQLPLLVEWRKEGATVESLELDLIENSRFPLPPKSEQHVIAEFLDRETGKIDALVAKKERLIDLLQEKRTALIAHAVTKGLDPAVPMKDSGIEWLGEIPTHWTIERTKFVARLESGHTPSRQHPEYWENCTIPWFGLVDVWQIRDGYREYVYETNEKISELGLTHSSARLLPKGTVILSRTASVGFSAILGVDMATTQDFVNWVCGSRILPEYLLYVFRAMGPEFQRLTMGSTHQTIYMPDASRFCTPVPPVEDQVRIVANIRTELTKIDCLISKIYEGIARLKEFRTALISAAVTGKIDVREEVA